MNDNIKYKEIEREQYFKFYINLTCDLTNDKYYTVIYSIAFYCSDYNPYMLCSATFYITLHNILKKCYRKEIFNRVPV